jgi:phospholipid/cholesterol/gamma-HCH transport system substrate-binding protein
MSKSKMEWKVGLFVFIGLVLLAALMLNFSKGMSFFKKTYALRLRAENAGGIKEKAAVMMSGIKVGNVTDAQLSTNGFVIIRLKIYDEFKIDRSAHFLIDALGFLGDQYIAIVSTNNTGQYLTNNQEVICEPPLNLQEAMRSTAGLLQQAQATMHTLDTAVSNVNRAILNDTTLTSLSQAIGNIQTISSNANQTLGRIDRLVDTNAPVLSASLSNLYGFSAELKTVLATNQNEISDAVKNLRSASVTANQLLNDVKATNGTAGLLLRDEQMKQQITALVTNLNSVAVNFGTFSSNLNNRGIWSMLWKPKQPKKSERDR